MRSHGYLVGDELRSNLESPIVRKPALPELGTYQQRGLGTASRMTINAMACPYPTKSFPRAHHIRPPHPWVGKCDPISLLCHLYSPPLPERKKKERETKKKSSPAWGTCHIVRGPCSGGGGEGMVTLSRLQPNLPYDLNTHCHG